MNWNLKPTLDSKESLVYVYSWQCLLLRKSANFSQRTEKWDGQVEFSLSQSLKSTSFSETEGTHSVQTTCKVLVAQSCLTLCDPMDCSPPVSSVHGIFRARNLERVAISNSRGSSRPRDQTHASCISCTGRSILYHCAVWESTHHVPLSQILMYWNNFTSFMTFISGTAVQWWSYYSNCPSKWRCSQVSICHSLLSLYAFVFQLHQGFN